MYRTYNLEEYNEAVKLRNNFGWGSTKISSFLKNKGIYIKKRAIDRWIYNNGKPFNEVIRKKILTTSNLLTKEKSYVLGVLCGDGYIRVQDSKSYLVGLDVCDEEFADEFKRCLEVIYGLFPSKKLRKVRPTNFCKNPKRSYVINLTSKNAAMDLFRYCESFKTWDWEVPKEILESSLEIKSYFLKGIFDSEGTIRLKHKGHAMLQICSGNIESFLLVKNILEDDFNIKMSVRYSQSNAIVLYTENYACIKNFSDKINFFIKRKKDMLSFCLSSYKRKGLRKYSKEFKLNALKMLDEGFSVRKIGEILDFPRTNVYDFTKQFNKEDIKNGNIQRKSEI